MPTSYHYKEKSIHNLIDYLRNLDERAKKIWVMVLSGISIFIVFVFWVLYINATIEKIPTAQVEQNSISITRTNETKENPLISNFKRNSGAIYNKIKAMILGVTNKSNDIMIEKNIGN